MPQVKVRHGAVTWQVRVGKREQTETAFRNMVVDMPQSEIDRLKPLGAVVDVNEELPLGGRLTPIPSTASDQELIAWASVANRDEIIAEIQRQPALGDRILAAHEIVQRQLEEQNELLGGLKPDIEEIREKAERDAAHEAERAERQRVADEHAAEEARKASEAASAAMLAAQAASQSSPQDELDDPDDVVKRKVGEVTEYIAKHPGQAAEIMEAENRRAASATAENEKQPRPGVIKAVQAAAGHTAQ